MKDAGDVVAQLNPDLSVTKLEVDASPMLDLVEVCERRASGAGVLITHRYFDRLEASKFARDLLGAVAALDDAELEHPDPAASRAVRGAGPELAVPAAELPRFELAYLVATNDTEPKFGVWDASQNVLLANRWPINNRQVAIEAVDSMNRSRVPDADITPINHAGRPEESA